MGNGPDLPVISVASQEAWEAWLEEHHATSDGLWLKIAKKGTGLETVSYAEALETALCYGWSDSQKSSFDDEFWLQRFTPRKARSKWSKVNRSKVTKLIEEGRMKSAGLREVERAKADGRWDAAYDAQSTATVPDDLRRALEKNETARKFFSTLDSANRYAILDQIQNAKRPETRARRIEKYVVMLSEQKKLYPCDRRCFSGGRCPGTRASSVTWVARSRALSLPSSTGFDDGERAEEGIEEECGEPAWSFGAASVGSGDAGGRARQPALGDRLRARRRGVARVREARRRYYRRDRPVTKDDRAGDQAERGPRRRGRSLLSDRIPGAGRPRWRPVR